MINKAAGEEITADNLIAEFDEDGDGARCEEETVGCPLLLKWKHIIAKGHPMGQHSACRSGV
jgi:hypothetical protein